MTKLFRITTVPQSLDGLLKGQLQYMKESGFEVFGVSSSGERLDIVAREQGVRTVAIEMTRNISPLKDLKALWRFYKLCRKEKPTIVHSHTPKAGVIGMLGAKLARVPIRLHTVAGLPLMEAKGNKRRLLDVVEKLTYSCATKIYPNSKGLYDFILSQKYTKPEKLKIIGYGSSNGVDTAQFDPKLISKEAKFRLREELRIDTEDFVFIFVGRVVSDKGVNELIEAYDRLSRKIDRIKLLIVGGQGDDDPISKNSLQKIRTNTSIIRTGSVKNVMPYYAISHVLTFPSYREGFPNVVMEAATMQLNAIVSDINGCNEIITDGRNGWLVPPKNVKELEEKMLWCVKNHRISEEMGQKSRGLMKKKYERRFVWKELLAEYCRVMNNR